MSDQAKSEGGLSRDVGRALIARFRDRFPSAMECLEKDLERCLTSRRFPVEHRKRIRTTNLLERTFGESRRRTKVIPRFTGERACLTVVLASPITASASGAGPDDAQDPAGPRRGSRPEGTPREESAAA